MSKNNLLSFSYEKLSNGVGKFQTNIGEIIGKYEIVKDSFYEHKGISTKFKQNKFVNAFVSNDLYNYKLSSINGKWKVVDKSELFYFDGGRYSEESITDIIKKRKRLNEINKKYVLKEKETVVIKDFDDYICKKCGQSPYRFHYDRDTGEEVIDFGTICICCNRVIVETNDLLRKN